MFETHEWLYEGFLISTDKLRLSLDTIRDLLSRSYWAQNRSLETIAKSIENSICYGVYFGEEQIGFARVVTDYATMYWVCDVIIDERQRKRNLGKILLKCIVETEELKNLRGVLATQDAHGLYQKFGFNTVNGKFMVRMP